MTTGESSPTSYGADRPGEIHAVPVRHPWRWVAVGVIVLLLAMFVHMLFTNPEFHWSFVFDVMGREPVVRGLLWGTLFIGLVSMLLSILVGVLIAIMRLSDNPLLRTVAFVWTWVWRGIPRYVLLFLVANLGILFAKTGIQIGVPFDTYVMDWLGISGDWRFLTLSPNEIFQGTLAAIIGLTLSESAYMAEIARAGILSVDKGQAEAAQAVGMNRSLTMRRIVLPQAMRVIVPPTSSEFISMFKDTSLLIAVPVTNELFFQANSIGSRNFLVLPTAIAAALYYLTLITILMLIQSRIERHFGRGYAPVSKKQQVVVMATGSEGAGGHR